MNCTNGDLAIITSVHRERDRRFVGLVLRLGRVVQRYRGRAYWSFIDCPTLAAAGVDSVCDRFLFPLRDVDGLDETLVERPVSNLLQLQAQVRAAHESWSAVERFARHVRLQRGRAA